MELFASDPWFPCGLSSIGSHYSSLDSKAHDWLQFSFVYLSWHTYIHILYIYILQFHPQPLLGVTFLYVAFYFTIVLQVISGTNGRRERPCAHYCIVWCTGCANPCCVPGPEHLWYWSCHRKSSWFHSLCWWSSQCRWWELWNHQAHCDFAIPTRPLWYSIP